MKEWAMTMCATGIGCSLLSSLCPKGRIRRIFGLLTALIYFCCLLLPVQEVGRWIADVFAVSVNVETPKAVTDTAVSQTVQLIEETLLEDAKERLASYGVTVKKVEVKGDITSVESIHIECVTVTFDKRDHPVSRDIVLLLEQAWGVTTEVQYVGE